MTDLLTICTKEEKYAVIQFLWSDSVLPAHVDVRPDPSSVPLVWPFFNA
jgi:hypothetical protein